MTNATKAQIIALVNALMVLATAFDLALTSTQQGAIALVVNAALSLWVGLTYKDSPKRVPELTEAEEQAPSTVGAKPDSF